MTSTRTDGTWRKTAIVFVCALAWTAVVCEGAGHVRARHLTGGWKPRDDLAGPVVTTGLGAVRGRWWQHEQTGAMGQSFLGMPFAAPPVGELRWVPPQPAASWEGVRDASSFGPDCMQISGSVPTTPGMSEDCLYINVFVPVGGNNTDAGPLPVAHWIYGGSFVTGGGDYLVGPKDVQGVYSGLNLAVSQSVVVVSFNYRLGPFGFLSLPELLHEDPSMPTTGNYGLQDQRASLEWTAAHIASFGGDPESVTLFGESAGAISVLFQFTSPRTKGLFHRVIVESGDGKDVILQDLAFAQGAKFSTALDCSGGGGALLECLRAHNSSDVLYALPIAPLGSTDGASWGPTIDDYEVSLPPNMLIEQGQYAKDTPMIIGTNHASCTLFVMRSAAGRDMTATQLHDLVAALWDPRFTDAILGWYPLSDYSVAPPAEAWAAMLSDYIFKCPSRTTAGLLAERGTATYLYDFQYVPECSYIPDWSQMKAYFGAYHFAEVPYVLGNNPSATCDFTANGTAVSQFLQGTWGAYIRTGAMPEEWPLYSNATQENLVIDVERSVETHYRAGVCDFWKTVPPPHVS